MTMPRKSAPEQSRSGRPAAVTREQWLYAGLEQFAAGGEGAVRIERIARDLGVTKGSYYGYFKSRDEFLRQMLEYSLQIGTEDFITRSRAASEPNDQMRLLLTDILKDRAGRDFEFYLRDYGQRNALAKRIAKQADERRTGYIREILERSGLPPAEAAARAEIGYCYYLGWYERNKHTALSRRELRRQLELFGRITSVDLTSEE